MPDDDFDKRVKQQILDAYGYASEAELDAAIEEELPGLLATEAERKEREAAYLAELPGRMEETQRSVTALFRGQGLLPDGVEFAWTAKPTPQRDQIADAFEALGRRIAEQWAAAVPAMTAAFDQIAKNVTAAALALQKLGFDVQFRPGARSCPHQPLDRPCSFCYPVPNPAGRDYRRRTRHRNRRRKS